MALGRRMRPKVVLANGCFDPFHVGHLRHLLAAATYGTRLVVSVTRDAYVNKGPRRPVFSEMERLEVIAHLRIVDSALLVDNALDALQTVKPDVFVKGADYRGKIEPEHYVYCRVHGIEIAFTDEPAYSSTKLLHHYA